MRVVNAVCRSRDLFEDDFELTSRQGIIYSVQEFGVWLVFSRPHVPGEHARAQRPALRYSEVDQATADSYVRVLVNPDRSGTS